MIFYFQKMPSPVGFLYLVTDAKDLIGVIFESGWPQYQKSFESFSLTEGLSTILNHAENQLREYFEGRRTDFNLPIRLTGTQFQNEVWAELLKIPYGQTITYGEQASAIGRPKAVRAVGGTNGRNKINIVVPCHRVISRTGKLTGYGGGIKTKEFLLRLEGVLIQVP